MAVGAIFFWNINLRKTWTKNILSGPWTETYIIYNITSILGKMSNTKKFIFMYFIHDIVEGLLLRIYYMIPLMPVFLLIKKVLFILDHAYDKFPCFGVPPQCCNVVQRQRGQWGDGTGWIQTQQ